MKRRRRGLLVAFLLLVLAAGIAILRLPAWTGRLLAARLAASFERPASVGKVEFRAFPLELLIDDIRVGGLRPGAPPFLAVRRAAVVPSVRSFWGPRLVLERLRLEGLVLRINAFPEGGDDIPKPRRKGGGGEVRIRRLSIRDGAFVLNHRRVPLELDLPDFRGRLAARRAGILGGGLSFGPGTLRFGDAAPFRISTEMEVILDGSHLEVTSGHVRAEGTDVAYHGSIRIAAHPLGEFDLNGRVDLAMLDRHVIRSSFGIQGDGHYKGRLAVDGSRLRLSGRLTGTRGEFDRVAIPTYQGEVGYDGEGLHIRDLAVTALGGSGLVDLEIPPGPAVARWSGHVSAIDAESAWRAIFEIGETGLSGSASGDFAVEWPKGRFRDLSGRMGLDIVARPDGRRRTLAGRFDWRAEHGVQLIDQADLRTPTTHVRLAGRIERDDRTALTVDGESRDLAAADDVLTRLRRALGSPEVERLGVSGSGAFQGRWTGTLQVPVFEGRFNGQDVGYLGVSWGRAEWVGSLDPTEVRSHSLVLRKGESELWLDGPMQTGYYGAADGLDVRVRITSWPAEDLLDALRWDLKLTGRVSGEASVRGRRSAPQGRLHLTASAGRYYGVAFTDLELRSRLEGPVSQGEGEVRVGGGHVRFDGSLTDDGFYDGQAQVDGVDVGEVLPSVASGANLAGRVTGALTLQGTLERPRVTGRLVSRRLFLGDEGLGAIEASLQGSGDGTVRVLGTCQSPRVNLLVDGTIAASAPYEASLRIAARGTSLDPFLRVVRPALPSVVGIIATGDLRVSGPLLTPSRMVAEASVPDLEIRLPEYPMRNRDPIDVGISGGRLEVRNLVLAGEGTDLAVRGSATVLGAGPVDLSLRGSADLRALGAVTRRLRGRGSARLAMTVSGTTDAPRVDGRLELEGAGIRARGFPHGIEDVRGTVHFTEAAAQFSDVAGSLGGGAVSLSGGAAYGGGALRSFDIQASGRGISLRYPEGLRSRIDADLRLFGDAKTQWVTGSVDVRQALWTRRYDLATEILSSRAAFAPPHPSLGGGIRYDVRVRAPGTLRLDNNLATLQARADLHLEGTYDAPVVVGRAEVERGRIYFQGNTYVIRRGVIDFANPQKIDPLFDIEAETRVRSYRVTLDVNGTLERVSPTLTSDPPLSTLQILNLLAGGQDVASLAQAQADQANLAATGAATLAAGALSEEVGLERGAQRLFGLNRFSIDPSVLKGGITNPTARLTVGKRITPDLNVLYSVDLRGTEERILSVEYTLSDRFSLLLTREDPGGLGFDLRLIRSY